MPTRFGIRTSFVVLACSVLAAASPVSASQVKFRWDQCFGDGGVQNKTFACTANTGTDVVVASFVPDVPLLGVGGIESRVDIAFGGAAVPAWWRTARAVIPILRRRAT